MLQQEQEVVKYDPEFMKILNNFVYFEDSRMPLLNYFFVEKIMVNRLVLNMICFAVYKLIVQYTIDYFLHYGDIKTHRQRYRKTDR